MIGERQIDSFTALTLATEAGGGLEAAFAPSAGMVGCSLTHRGEQLLGRRGGLARYVERHTTMGIPFLYPWANRLGATRFEVAGRVVDLEAAAPPPARGPHGLPIHGLLSAAGGWRVERHEPTPQGGTLAASFDFDAHPGLTAAFPFPHRIEITATLRETRLTITTAVEPTADVAVPIAFGFHPYLRLPGVERRDWAVVLPVRERLEVDGRMLPTGARKPVRIEDGPLGSRTFDDGFVAPEGGAPFVLGGGGLRIELTLDPHYPFAQVYAPDDDDVIAFEPMTAPTNALVAGGRDLRLIEPGDRFEAEFAITVLELDANPESGSG